MPTGGTGGQSSTLGTIAIKAQQARAIRQRLGMDQPNGGASAGQMQPAAPTTPNSSAGPDLDIDSAIAKAFDQRGPQMEETVRRSMGGLMQEDVGGAGLEGPGVVEAPSAPFQSPFDYMSSESRPLTEQLEHLGAVSVSPQEQFARVAGRMPSPREMTVFNARMVLEQQLGRPPTSNELKMQLLRPEESDNSFPRAFEMEAQ